jgi:hypothetical protein
MAPMPDEQDIEIECGSKIDIEAYDEHLNKIIYWVTANPPKQASGPPTQTGGSVAQPGPANPVAGDGQVSGGDWVGAPITTGGSHAAVIVVGGELTEP